MAGCLSAGARKVFGGGCLFGAVLTHMYTRQPSSGGQVARAEDSPPSVTSPVVSGSLLVPLLDLHEDPRVVCKIHDPRRGDSLLERVVKEMIIDAIKAAEHVPEPSSAEVLPWLKWHTERQEAIRRLEILQTQGGQQLAVDKLMNNGKAAFKRSWSQPGNLNQQDKDALADGGFEGLRLQLPKAFRPLHGANGQQGLALGLDAEPSHKHPHYKNWLPQGGAGRKNDIDELTLREKLKEKGAPEAVLGPESVEYTALKNGFQKEKVV